LSLGGTNKEARLVYLPSIIVCHCAGVTKCRWGNIPAVTLLLAILPESVGSANIPVDNTSLAPTSGISVGPITASVPLALPTDSGNMASSKVTAGMFPHLHLVTPSTGILSNISLCLFTVSPRDFNVDRISRMSLLGINPLLSVVEIELEELENEKFSP
jgi:hypothetical protein